jgi:hypothetical protein
MAFGGSPVYIWTIALTDGHFKSHLQRIFCSRRRTLFCLKIPRIGDVDIATKMLQLPSVKIITLFQLS